MWPWLFWVLFGPAVGPCCLARLWAVARPIDGVACGPTAPRVFRVPSGPAAREIATRELRSEWSISKPARALRTLRHPPHQWHLWCCD